MGRRNSASAQIALGRLSVKDALRLTIALPPNVSLPSGVRVGIDGEDENPPDLAWRRCLLGGCVAEADVRDDLPHARLTRSATGQIRYAVASGQTA